jgi:hypothetical protein
MSSTPLGRYDASLETELADLVRVEIERRFADQRPEIGKGAHVATFTCQSRSLGDVIVEVEDDGVVVYVVDMWHRHFDEGTDQEVVAECAGFLDDLFHDKVVVWVARRGGRMLGGGSFYRDAPAPPSGQVSRRLSRKADEIRAGTWSAPFVVDGIDEDAEAALADLARVELARRFADRRPETGEGARVATFTSPSIGDIVVEAEGASLVMRVVRIAFFLTFPRKQGTPEEVVAECAAFLDNVFHDKVVFYRSDAVRVHGRLSAGFFYPDDPGSTGREFVRWLSQEADDLRAATWSGPWEDDGIVAHG